MTPREELLAAAQFYREAVADEPGDDGAEFLDILADWLTDEANRHVHLSYLDSGYEEVSVWEHSAMTPEIVAFQPSIRMARLTIRTMMEEDDAASVPSLPEADQ